MQSQRAASATNMPILYSPFQSNAEIEHHLVPVVQCLDCPEKVCFEISTCYENSSIKPHLNRVDHCQIRHNRKHEAWRAAHNGCFWPSIGQYGSSSAALQEHGLSILAVKTKDLNFLKRVLPEKCTVLEKDNSHRSALHWACQLGRQDMAELLVRFGASLDDYDDQAQTPLDLALDVSKDFAIRLIQILAEEKRNESWFAADTPLVLACRLNRLSVVEGLVDAGADVNEPTINFAIAIAVRHASWEVVHYLLAKGAVLGVVDIVHIRRLVDKRAGTYIGSDYQDALEKIKLLEQHGLNFGDKIEALSTLL